MTDNTILALTGMGITPYSARGLTQSLEPIEAIKTARRTINGALKDLSQPQFQKYKSTINGTDQDPPAVDGIWPGMVLTVDCIAELAAPTNSAGPIRPIVPGSQRDADGFTFYRPRLSMMIVGFTVTKDEWGATVSWQLQLEEV